MFIITSHTHTQRWLWWCHERRRSISMCLALAHSRRCQTVTSWAELNTRIWMKRNHQRSLSDVWCLTQGFMVLIYIYTYTQYTTKGYDRTQINTKDQSCDITPQIWHLINFRFYNEHIQMSTIILNIYFYVKTKSIWLVYFSFSFCLSL